MVTVSRQKISAPLIRGAARQIKHAERSQLIQIYDQYRALSNDQIRRAVIERNRVDILATEVLGYTVKPMHLKMMRFQFQHRDSLQLAFRGGGKCLGLGTPVMLYSGEAKAAEDVQPGDLLMGPDSTPREVLSTTRGRGPLFRIEPIKGDPWVCNDVHVLTLLGRGYHDGEIRDVPLIDLLVEAAGNKRGTRDLQWKLFRVPLTFESQPIAIDPYFFGVWLGDGSTADARISNPEPEIVNACREYANSIGMDVVSRWIERSNYFDIRIISGNKNHWLKRLLVSGGKRIPQNYLINSEAVRLELLAGLLDTDGHLHNNCYEVTQKREALARQVVWLARSLGFAAYIKSAEKACQTGAVGTYWRVGISGDTDRIPCRVARKKASARQQPKNVLVNGFEVKPLGKGEYAGFELDGDGRFLLGDFTVTHNTTVCTVTKAVHYLIKNRDFRIVLTSKTKGNAEGFLKEIKGHLENNQRLIEIFGPFYDPSRVGKWDNSEIEVVGKQKATKEASITCVGVDSAVVSKHYDAILGDDMVDENNARTHYMRESVRVFYYQTLMPTLEPPDPLVPHRGENHKQGTRYHFADLYGHQIENELKEHHQIIPALDEQERSPWPEKYTPEWFKDLRKQMGTILFSCQYQNNTDAMRGEIFEYDDCQQIDESEYPKLEDLKIFTGIDLAISEKEENDQFAIITVGMTGKFDAPNIFVLDYYTGRLRFSEQTEKIVEHYKRWQPLRMGIESNAYQAAQYQQLKEKHPGMRVRPINTDKDKITRAWKLSAHFEDKRVFFKKAVHGPIIDQLVLFPHFKFKDLFDALDLAITTSRKRKKGRGSRRREPGLI